MPECWLCSMALISKRELKQHLQARHGRLKVRCPWCMGEEKDFSRIFDLKRHVGTCHKPIFDSLPGGFFNEPNGVWLSVYPRDYCQVTAVRDARPLESDLAKQAISNWFDSMPAPTRSREEWEEGWRLVPTDEVVPTEAHLPRPFPLWVSQDRTPLCIPSLRDPFKFPDPMEADDAVSHYSYASLSSETAFGNLGSPRNGHAEYPNSPTPSPSSTANLAPGSPVYSRTPSPSSNANIAPRPQEYSPTPSPSSTNANIAPRQPEYTPTPIPSSNANITTSPPEYSPTPSPSSTNTIATRPPVYPPTPSPSSSDTTITSPPVCSPTLSPSSNANITTRPPVYPPTPSTSPSSSDTTITSPPVCSPTPSPSSNANITMKLPVYSLMPSTSSADAPVAPPTSTLTAAVADLRNRAWQLLYYGGMPVFPPARRDWTVVRALVLRSGETTVLWPPVNWTIMDADQRLLALEVAAHSLNVSNAGTLVTRGRLVDRYNMLALPGTKDVALSTGEQAERKARYYLYEVLRVAAMTGRIDLLYLEMLEAAARQRSRGTDGVIEQISAAKLRLV